MKSYCHCEHCANPGNKQHAWQKELLEQTPGRLVPLPATPFQTSMLSIAFPVFFTYITNTFLPVVLFVSHTCHRAAISAFQHSHSTELSEVSIRTVSPLKLAQKWDRSNIRATESFLYQLDLETRCFATNSSALSGSQALPAISAHQTLAEQRVF